MGYRGCIRERKGGLKETELECHKDASQRLPKREKRRA
jgi:hypothetical protein